VVVTQNIVRCAVWLLFALAGTSGIFFLLGADFVGATQLLVYVGGTLVLVVFGVMLTAQGPFISLRSGAAEWAISTLVGLLLYGVLAVSILGRPWTFPNPGPTDPSGMSMDNPAASMNSVVLGEAPLGVKEVTTTSRLSGLAGNAAPPRTRMGYLLPFEIVSVPLLVVLIGAAYLARAQ